MLKCKHNEDCSLYPACGHTCGVPVEELLRMKSQHVRELEHYTNDLIRYQLNLIETALNKAKNLVEKSDYTPTCPCGYTDCISDPAYIRCYHPEWWEELGMPTECKDLHYGQDKYKDEGDYLWCPYYDDEDK